jgi:hypothetical protein
MAQSVSVTPTVDTSAYASGDRLGSLMTLTAVNPNGDTAPALLSSIVILDMAAQRAAMDILFFHTSPTIASADNAAIDISDANAAYLVGHVSVVAGDYTNLTANAVATVKNLNLHLKVNSSGTLYALIVSRGSPTYAAASDLKLTFTFA